jgi:hypothetical protein
MTCTAFSDIKQIYQPNALQLGPFYFYRPNIPILSIYSVEAGRDSLPALILFIRQETKEIKFHGQIHYVLEVLLIRSTDETPFPK